MRHVIIKPTGSVAVVKLIEQLISKEYSKLSISIFRDLLSYSVSKGTFNSRSPTVILEYSIFNKFLPQYNLRYELYKMHQAFNRNNGYLINALDIIGNFIPTIQIAHSSDG